MPLWTPFSRKPAKSAETAPPKPRRSHSDTSAQWGLSAETGRARPPGRPKTAMSATAPVPKSMLLEPKPANLPVEDRAGEKSHLASSQSGSLLDSREESDALGAGEALSGMEHETKAEPIEPCFIQRFSDHSIGSSSCATETHPTQLMEIHPTQLMETHAESHTETEPKTTEDQSQKREELKWVKLSSKPIFDGANGTIYKASDAASTKIVVIKSVRKQPSQAYENYSLLVHREYDNLRKCAASKHVVEVYDLVADSAPEPELSLIIKYFQHGDLLDYLCGLRSKKIDIPTHLKDAVFKQIVKAVDFLHRNDVVHRDIKPENFLIDQNGELKLNDFGYSLDLSRIDEQLPLNGTCCGTPSFMAPELYRIENGKRDSGSPDSDSDDYAERRKKFARLEKMLCSEKPDQEVDFKSVDVWALGIVCFQVYLMSVPWQSSNIFEDKNKKMELYMENYPDGANQLRSLVDKLNDKNFGVTLNPALTLFKKIHYDARIELLRMLHPNPNKRISCGELLQSSWLTQAYAKPRDLLDLRK